ncbi:major facilitator superfamily domain-containing protein [Leptodontidium sp. 2 PMI_412]|nr:major facilitator superfamily domain-containing protein [Leptodontidium sp. 2 PMI_412]
MSGKDHSLPDPILTDSDISRDEEKLASVDQSQPEEPEILLSEFNLRSILVLIGSFLALFCSVGFVNAFGIFQEYYSSHILALKSASDISWLGSFNVFCMFGTTIIVGYLNDKHGPRILLASGSLTIVFALFMTSLCKDYYQFFLAQGLLLGLGLAFVFLPSIAVIPRYFTHHRGLAMGIVVSGSSMGGVIWPIALQNFFDSVGFGWGVRISAFMMVPLLGFAILTVRVPMPIAPPSSIRINANISISKQPKPKPDISVIKNPILLLLAAGLFLVYLGLFSPFFYITSWTISLGLDANMGFYMVSIINAASLFGRILPGLWADRIGAYNIMVVSAGLSGVVCMCWTEATSIGGIVVLSLAYGFVSGAVIGLQGACASQIAKPHQYGVVMGFTMSVISIAGLIGSPINGQLLSKWQYLGLSLFSGLAMLLGMLVLILAKLRVNPVFFGKA